MQCGSFIVSSLKVEHVVGPIESQTRKPESEVNLTHRPILNTTITGGQKTSKQAIVFSLNHKEVVYSWNKLSDNRTLNSTTQRLTRRFLPS
jgi:hypothetical protein